MNGIEKEIIEVALDDIIPNRFQPRLSFDEQALNDLAESIRQHGIIQPLVLRKIGNKYEIIAGERRYKASYIAGLTRVPAVIINLNDNESAEVAIVENLQRQDLSAIEEAKSYKKLLDRGYLTQDQLATRMGKTQATISNKLRLLNLDQQVQDALLNNKISERHARSLLRLTDKNDQIDMLNEIINNRLNVRVTDEEISRRIKGDVPKTIIENNKLNNIEKQNEEMLDINNNFDNPESFFSNSNKQVESLEPINKDDFVRPISNVTPVNNEYINPNISNEQALQGLYQNEQVEQPSQNVNPIPFIRPVMNDNYELPSINPINAETTIEPMPKQMPISESILPFNSTETKDLQIVEDKINKIIKELNEIGFKIKLEEYDFENLYQYVIKVEKN